MGELHAYGEACDEYVRYVRDEKQRSASTVSDYRNSIRNRLKEEFGGDTSLGSITTVQIDAYRAKLLVERELSRRSVQKLRSSTTGSSSARSARAGSRRTPPRTPSA